MSRFDRGVGLARSLAIYHGIPLRQRRLRRLYGRFVGAGDLVFDIGAHAGNRVRAYAALGCQVPALSFEYLPRVLHEVQVCLTRLVDLGQYQFNWSVGESYQLASDRWLDASEVLATLRTPAAQR